MNKDKDSKPRQFQNPIFPVHRQLGVAVAELYQDAIASHQGTFYQVTAIAAKRSLFVPAVVYDQLRQKVRLFDPTFMSMLPNYPDISEFDGDMSEWMQAVNDRIRVEEPEMIMAQITDPLSMFRCDRCGALVPLSSHRIGPDRVCPICGHEVFQAPLFVFKGPVSAEKLPPKALEKLSAPPCDQCKRNGKTVWLRAKPLDKRAPFGTLRLYCPDCDKGPAAKHARPVARKGRRITLPSQSLIRPVSATVCEVGEHGSPLPIAGALSEEYLEALSYHKQLQVYQIVFGYSFHDSGLTKPLAKYSGRKFKTQGIEIRLRQDCYDKLLAHLQSVYADKDLYQEFVRDLQKPGSAYFHADEQSDHEQYDRDQLRRWTLHSLAHAFMIMVPLKTGLEATKFGYSYDVPRGRVVIYDNEEGGIGGCQTLAEESTWTEFLEVTRRHIAHCDCRARCYRCVVLNQCGEINNALNRHLLGPILGIATDYE